MLSPITPAPSAWSFWKKDWACLALLIVLVVPLRAWLVYNTEVPARDSVGYVRYALHFEQFSWGQVLERHHQHPGYPVAVWLVSLPVRAWLGTTPDSMLLSTQLASSLAAVLLLFPSYFLGKRLLGRAVAFWSALWFQVLPVCAHHLSDGISESVFLLLAASALHFAVTAFDAYSWRRFALCGLFTGLAYLTRPEGALVLIATLIVLTGIQLRSRPLTWKSWLGLGGAVIVPAVLVGSLYFGFTGKFTNKPSGRHVLGTEPIDATSAVPMNARAIAWPLQANLFAVSIKRSDSLATRFARGAGGVVTEVANVFHYVGGLAALAGLWWFSPALRRIPGSWVLLAYGLMVVFILVRLAMVVFYVSDRHVLILVFCLMAPATAGLLEAPQRLWAWRHRRGAVSRMASVPAASAILLLVTLGLGLPKTLERIHGNRAGNHAAGAWLAKTVVRGDIVVDDHSWSNYYAGQVFVEGKEPILPRDYQPTCYIVMTRSKDLEIAGQRNRTEEQIRADKGRIVYHWPEHRSADDARVVVYAKPRRFDEHPWNVGP